MTVSALRSAASLIALAAASPAFAATIETASKIDAVTVYPDAASITRVVEIDLPALVRHLAGDPELQG